MPEFIYRSTNWTSSFVPVNKNTDEHQCKLLEGVYETGTPLMMKILTELGSISKLAVVDGSRKNQKSYNLKDLKIVNKPTEGIYLNERVSYKRSFLYVRMNSKSKTGLVALFTINGGSGEQRSADNDLTTPSKSGADSFDISTSCQLWVVKPGSKAKGGQKSLSLKQSSELFSQLLSTIHEEADLESEYACVSKLSKCEITDLTFVVDETAAYSAANESISKMLKNSGPTFMLVNSSRPTVYLRKHVPTLNSLPAISLPFPPGPDHNPVTSTLPSLNWEQPIVQLCLEAYLYMNVVSFPKRIGYARYGNLPIGNLGDEENFTLYDISLTRMLQKNRAVSWASPVSGRPDLGASFFPSSDGKFRPSIQLAGSSDVNSEDIWSDDNELLSPVIRRPGSYRSLCVDIDLHDLAIAALADTSNLSTNTMMSNDIGSPTSVMQGSGGALKLSEPLGDEMSTATSLPMVRALVGAWLRDAFASNSSVADSMLHNVYRLISAPETRMHDPALHRALHALMRGTFMRLLGELQRLGCSIVYANFHKITIATNKTCLADAEEYVNFVISTIRNQVGENGEDFSGLARVALRPRQYHTHLLFLDEYNFGTMHLERCDRDEVDRDYFIEEDTTENTVVVPSVVTAWSLMNYMGSDIAEEYFRIIIGRFSRDVLKKEKDLISRDGSGNLPSLFDKEMNEKVLEYKRKMISKQFATTLTRAVGEIAKEEEENRNNKESSSSRRNLLINNDSQIMPVLAFVKSVIVILELDQEVDREIHVLKRSLLAQIGVAEYSSLARWVNPCPTLMLPDCFCNECQESRDVNVCYIPPAEEDDAYQIHWFCGDCGTEYDVAMIERRLVEQAHKKMLRYQLQDLRCTKTNRVATRSLARVSQCSAEWKLDISPEQGRSEIETLCRLAEYHQLDELEWTTQGMLQSFR